MKKKDFKLPVWITIALASLLLAISAAYFIDIRQERASVKSSETLRHLPYERKKVKRDATNIKTQYKLIPHQLLQPKPFDLSYCNQLKS